MTTSSSSTGMNRRHLLRGGLLGAGLFGLRALATGLPASLLLASDRALADGTACGLPDKAKAQYLILSINQNGDPLNANAPGCYDDPGIVHPADPTMAATVLKLGAVSSKAAAPWAALPQWVLDRTCFFHMATMTTIHPDLPKVLKMMGSTVGQEMLPAILAGSLAPCMATVQQTPVSLVGSTAAEYVTAKGRVMPNLNATALRDILTHPTGPLSNLGKLRDQSMDRIYARLKAAGGASAAQIAYVDSVAQSRGEARSISDTLLGNLSAIVANDANGQIIGAATLIAMNVTPVVVVRIPFGGDNHFDQALATESLQTVAGVGALGALMAKLQEFKIEDRVTFASLNTFGRTLKQLGDNGRNHWADHHVSVMIGKPIKGGVIGGLMPVAQKGDYGAMAIDSKTGRGSVGGDVPVDETLCSMGKTLGAALGVPQAVLDQNITRGKTIPAALA